MTTALTLLDIVNAVRVEINEPVEGFWKDTDIKRWANDGYADLVHAAKIEAAPALIPTVALQESYNLPADFWMARKMTREISPGGGLYKAMSVATLDDKAERVDAPGKYFIYKNQIWMIPIPDAVYNTKLFYYLEAPQLVNNTDIPIIEPAYHHLIWYWATWHAKRRDDDPAFQTYQTDYDTGRLGMIADLANRHQSEGFDVVTNDWKGMA